MSAISHKLKLLRKQEALSQKALADLTGISQGAIGDIESGRKQNFSGDSLFKLCNHPRLRKYTLWLISDPVSQVNEPESPYSLNLNKLVENLTPQQREQVAAFIQLLEKQSSAN